MEINEHTKIAQLLKAHPKAMETIISISPRFKKLENPILRKMLASRATIAMAAKIAGVSKEIFYQNLQPLGFEVAESVDKSTKAQNTEKPEWLKQRSPDEMLTLDVRILLEEGKDPLKIIMDSLKNLTKGHVFKLINSFEPVPLILLLEKKGYLHYHQEIAENVCRTYFFQANDNTDEVEIPEINVHDDWESFYLQISGNLQEIDVRELPMPLPMQTILNTLEGLKEEDALLVHHKKVPLFLLPELDDMGLAYRLRELETGEVQLLICREEMLQPNIV